MGIQWYDLYFLGIFSGAPGHSYISFGEVSAKPPMHLLKRVVILFLLIFLKPLIVGGSGQGLGAGGLPDTLCKARRTLSTVRPGE